MNKAFFALILPYQILYKRVAILQTYVLDDLCHFITFNKCYKMTQII